MALTADVVQYYQRRESFVRSLVDLVLILVVGLLALPVTAGESELRDAIAGDYDYLGPLFEHFHRHPELSYVEHETAARLAAELREAGLTVTEGVGGTGVVGVLENGPGPVSCARRGSP